MKPGQTERNEQMNTTAIPIPVDGMTAAAPAATARLIDAANDISAFASKDEKRYALNGIHCADRFTEATDGRILMRVPYVPIEASEFPQCSTPQTFTPGVIVPTRPYVEALKNAGRNSNLPVLNTVKLSDNGAPGKVMLTAHDLDNERIIAARTVEGTYPDTDQVWPDKDRKVQAIELSAELLKVLADYAIRHGREHGSSWKYHTVRLEIVDELSPVTFAVNLPDGRKAEGVMMPCRMSCAHKRLAARTASGL